LHFSNRRQTVKSSVEQQTFAVYVVVYQFLKREKRIEKTVCFARAKQGHIGCSLSGGAIWSKHMSSRLLKITGIPLMLLLLAWPQGSQATSLSPGLERAVKDLRSHATADSLVEVVVFLDDYEARGQLLKPLPAGASRDARIKKITSRLKSYRHPQRDNVLNFINANSSGEVVEFWIAPAIKTSLPVSTLEALSRMKGVRLVLENARLSYEPPVESTPALSTTTAAVSDQLNLMNIPALWSRGLKGSGRLVCSFDTGVEQPHPALASKWRGNHSTLTSAWFSKVAPDAIPFDLIGHGTHTMGVMVGAVEADTFGVAPEAEWITAGVIDQGRTLSMTFADIIEAFQWSLNPDGDENTTSDVPDVILNSWGIPKGLFSPCDDTFWGMIDYVEAAGIVTIFAAGNEGPDPETIRSPADRASSPLNAFSVGAVDNARVIASFSSRGPSSCDNSQIKPEVVAPGVSVRSSYKDGTYYVMTGTSMATPYVAGLVALVRQYNPDATVEEIKTAFLKAARDLGTTGEDNAYGHGLIDAGHVLDYIPAPNTGEMEVVGYEISGDGIAFAGETFELSLILRNSDDGYSTVSVRLELETEADVTIDVDSATFSFESSAATTASEQSFVLTYGPSLYNGQELDFRLVVSVASEPLDTLDFLLEVGLPPRGEIASHENNQISVSVSDFGQFGFAPGSIYNAMGEGFRLDGGNNWLYEAGLVVATDAALATSIRNGEGILKESDFSPVKSLSEELFGDDGGIHRTAVFADASANVPVSIEQETATYDGYGEEGFLIARYMLINKSLQRVSNLFFGVFSDFDLSAEDEVRIDESNGLIYQSDGNGNYVGIVSLEGTFVLQYMANGDTKTGFSDESLRQLLEANETTTESDELRDWMLCVTSGPFLLNPRQATVVAIAFVAGRTVGELYDNAASARAKYDVFTSLADNDMGYGSNSPRLYQNYPNPFNPITTISFSMTEDADVSLDVYNVLGQRVKSLYQGTLAAGLHTFEWTGVDEAGQRVASGVYFYRLRTESSSLTRKMLLIK